MNKINIENQIPIAIDLINEFIEDQKFFKKQDKEFGQVPKEYKGYIANFGASIIQSGLLATVAFYEQNDSKSNADRKILTKLILKTIYKNKKIEWKENETLLNYVLVNDTKKIEKDVIDAAIAIKLAIRVFNFTENSES
ncbi:putative CRISPR-associated protein [Clostridium botulinum]|uniref:type III-B CRISPR module-associated protein Cmr5 n=1 Tax=Clostridium botulinum TaxID=1491 RepID=UPI00058210D6|nr:type III-B CRISPR module-associated protein Cmr5 [Clostridium botulinum]BAQ13947.1 putative CRISPR-associated protein [Clostridium botulinum]